ncbi:MAG: ADP-ribosylglycohydrolase family protein, partial [Actinomycetota bacterium]
FRMLSSAGPWDGPARALFGGAGSFGNGAAMRAAPAALFAFNSPDQVAQIARDSARITHAHQLGIDGAVLQAQAVAFLLRTDPDSQLDVEAMLRCLRGSITSPRLSQSLEVIEAMLMLGATPAEVVQRLGNGQVAHRCVPTALFAFLSHPGSFTEAVLYAISLAGDTDTIASMTGVLAGARLGEDAIPDLWGSSVEGGAKMRLLAQALLCFAV